MKVKLKEKIAAQTALVKVAIDAGRAMTADEQTQFDALETEIKNLEATIEAQNKLAARQKAETEAEAKNRKIVEDEVLHAEPNAHKPVWRGFGEFLFAVKNAASPERIMDKRLIVTDAASGASEGIPSDGGFLVETQTTTELLKDTYETAVLAPRCKKVPISAGKNGLKLNMIDESSRADGSRQGGVLAYWEGETDALTASKPKFGILELNLKKLTGLYYATDELLQDATALESVITGFFGEEFGFKLDDAILRGTGAGMPLGILNSPALITVSKTASQTAKTFTFNNALDMWSRCRARNRMNAGWYINQEIEPQLAKMSFTIGTEGVPVYLPAGGASVTGYGTLFGRPVIPIEQAAALGDLGDIMLLDLNEYLLIDKGGINAASSIHVRFLYDEAVFRFIYRVDGQPKRKKPLTPYKGANTLSPFITLESRA
jgi:HK97 family phage major capsid protein